jgi:hypothetical protein
LNAEVDMHNLDIVDRYEKLARELAADGVTIVDKARVWHQRAIAALLWPINRRYLDGYVTTIGRTIYLPVGFGARDDGDRWATLRHERVHVEQFRRWGLVPMAIAYLLLPLPLGLAWCRMRLEREAYEETIRCHHVLGGRAATDAIRDHVIAQFVSGSYGWMWPFRRAMERWYDEFVDRLGEKPDLTS